MIQKEIVGYKVITALLDAFVSAAANTYYKQANSYDELILQLVPEDEGLQAENIYQTLLNCLLYTSDAADE